MGFFGLLEPDKNYGMMKMGLFVLYRFGDHQGKLRS
jgi:hypothetical protein